MAGISNSKAQSGVMPAGAGSMGSGVGAAQHGDEWETERGRGNGGGGQRGRGADVSSHLSDRRSGARREHHAYPAIVIRN